MITRIELKEENRAQVSLPSCQELKVLTFFITFSVMKMIGSERIYHNSMGGERKSLQAIVNGE